MNEFLNIWQDWLIGYIVFVIPGTILFFGLIVKTFKITLKNKRWIVFTAVLMITHAVFFTYYYLQTSRFGVVTKVTIAGDWIFAEGLLTDVGYEDRGVGVRRFHEDPSTTTEAQKIFILDKHTGETLKRIEDYQFAHYMDNKVLLVPTTVTKSFAVFNCRTLQFERFFQSGELLSDLPEYAERIEKISYDRSWLTVPGFSSHGKTAKPYFQVTLTDGSQWFYDVLSQKMIPNPDSYQTAQTNAALPKKPKREMTIGTFGKLTVTANFAPKTGFILSGGSEDQKRWTLTADEMFPMIKEKSTFFAENPNCFLSDDRYLYFFTTDRAAAIEFETGKLRWMKGI